ncbi:phosphate uptake regulator PhoU [Candidatus Woesearchaeota archaeon]|nr:phosphate uptake regulator PhoU [Candidatus Woesearchaeota archaeon]
MGETRKIQSIGGMTFTVSLPKEWVKKNKLKQQAELYIEEKDGALLLTPSRKTEATRKEIILPFTQYTPHIEQILFSAYYLGAQTVQIIAQEDIPAQSRLRIKGVLKNMTGAEIIYEDQKRIDIKVLLANDKIDIRQIFFRICLILIDEIDNIVDRQNREEFTIAEEEIDRLYHLVTKLLILSVRDRQILQSSGTQHELFILSYFLISKKLENIGDIFYKLQAHKVNVSIRKNMAVIRGLLEKYSRFFVKDPVPVKAIDVPQKMDIPPTEAKELLEEAYRYLKDISEELINLSFYAEQMKL